MCGPRANCQDHFERPERGFEFCIRCGPREALGATRGMPNAACLSFHKVNFHAGYTIRQKYVTQLN